MLNYCRCWMPGWTGSKIELISKLMYGICCLQAKGILQTLPLSLFCFDFNFLLLTLVKKHYLYLKIQLQIRLITMNFRVKAHQYAQLLPLRVNRGSPFLILETSGNHLFVMTYLTHWRLRQPELAAQDYTALKHCNFLNRSNIALTVSCEHCVECPSNWDIQ